MKKIWTLYIFLVFFLKNQSYCIGPILPNILPDPDYDSFTGKDVTYDVFGDKNKDIFPIAFGDFNSDKLTDVFTVSKDGQSVSLYLSKEESPLLELKSTCDLRVKTSEEYEEEKISVIGAVIGDFSGDGILDVLISYKQPPALSVEVIILPGNLTTIHCEGDIMPPISMVQEPLVLDVNGDMILDLFGEAWPENKTDPLDKSKPPKRIIWKFNKSDKGFKYDKIPFVLKDKKNYLFNYMSNPHSSAFVNMDGDFYPELITISSIQKSPNKPTTPTTTTKPTTASNNNITSTSPSPSTTPLNLENLEKSKNLQTFFYLESFKINVIESRGKEEISFTLKSNITLDPDVSHQINVVGQPIFMDINQTGVLIQLLPICTDKHCKNSGIWIVNTKEEKLEQLPISFKGETKELWMFLRQSVVEMPVNYSRSLVLRIGDYNLDGYPDLLATLIPVEGHRTDFQSRTVIFQNVPNTDIETKDRLPRTFKINFDALAQYKSVILSSFYDLHDDGLLDVFIVRKTNNGTTLKTSDFGILAIQNNPDYDANFMKVMVLTGRECEKCPKKIPYGNIIPGPIIKYETTTQDGYEKRAIAAQMYRTSHIPLDVPFTIFGIGHSPNFVDVLTISIGSKSQKWTQIIPNSQIIVIPQPIEESRKWTAKLFLTPSKGRINTFVVLLAFCFVLMIIVGVLQWREKRYDQKERALEARTFHIM